MTVFLVSARADGEAVALDIDGEPFRIEGSGSPIAPAPESALVAGLLPAMAVRRAVEVEGAISASVAANLPRLQEAIAGWGIGLRPVEVRARTATATPAGPRPLGALFSAGLDSMFAALRWRDELAGLVYVHGLTAWPPSGLARDEAADHARRAAAALGLPLAEVATDVRRRVQRDVARRFSLGAVLVCVAHALVPSFGRLVIPFGRFPADRAYGTGPRFEPLWSSERMEITGYGSHAPRVAKAAALAEHGDLLPFLQVCPKPGASRNCGRCTKCVATALSLQIAGVSRPPSFPRPVGVAEIESLAPVPFFIYMWSDLLEVMERADVPADLLRATRRYVRALRRDEGRWGRVRRAGAIAARALGRRDRPPSVLR